MGWRNLMHFKISMMPVAFVALACAFFSSSLYSQERLSSNKDLEVAVEDAVMCKGHGLDIFSGGNSGENPGEPNFQLKAVGVDINNADQYGGETIYRFPGNVRVFGHEAADATFFSSSTTIFFVNLRADAAEVRKINRLLKLRPVSRKDRYDYGYFDQFKAGYIRKIPNGTEIPPYVIFSAISSRNGRNHVVVGCQNNGE